MKNSSAQPTVGGKAAAKAAVRQVPKGGAGGKAAAVDVVIPTGGGPKLVGNDPGCDLKAGAEDCE